VTVDRHLLLARPRTAAAGRWLAVDMTGGERMFEFADPRQPVPGAPGAVVIAGRGDTCADVPGGGLSVTEDVVWSLLDPLARAWDGEPLPAEQTAAEADLRRLRRGLLAGVRRWRERDPTLRESCRSLLQGFRPGLDPLFDLLDVLPVAGAAAQPPASPAPAAPLSLPEPLPGDPDGIAAWLGSAQGLGALYGPEFAPRWEQADMARAVAAALADRRPLLVEAGTGVGKTLAYLVPLVASVVRADERAVVSTHTRALQRQILEQDLPRLAPLLGDHRFALLMGRRNYLCLRQRQSYLSRPLENQADALRAVAFRLWLEDTREGLREEAAAHPLLARDLGELFDAADLCLPGLCYEGDRCFVQTARRRARDADLLVVNHALLLNDLAQGRTLIGERDHLVVDESHRLPAVTLDTHGVLAGMGRWNDIEQLCGRLTGGERIPERVALAARRLGEMGHDGEKPAAACTDYGRDLARAGDVFVAWWQALGALVDEALPVTGRSLQRQRVRDKDEAFGGVRAETAALLEALAQAAEGFARLAAVTSSLDELPGPLQDDLAQLAQAGQLVRQLQHDVRFLVADGDENWVTWIEPSARRGLRLLGATPLDAGDLLRDYWGDADSHPVMTSATLAVGEDFTHMLGELGLARRRPPTETRACPSPFDYHRQTLVLAPTRFPGPEAPDFSQAVGEVLRDLALGTGRKTLGLFTSYRMIQDAAAVLEAAGLGDHPDPDHGLPALLVQKPQGAPGVLVDRFRRLDQAVLLGTATFWEGVDFPGEHLEVLVVAKLPFLVPNDPWVEARCERLQAAGENPFTKFMVRDAVLRLRQGFGRLIRRPSDRGVVVILDTRLHTRNYGATFLSALPVMPTGFGDSAELLDRVDRFFRDA
jgi:ATP-dependent DNA helicase DinG